jgi:hypothetical protein
MTEPPDDYRGGPDPRRGTVAGLVLVALLVVAALYLMQALHKQSKIEDCLMSGRSNCAPIEIPPRGN